jgi:hypothetical protein
MRCAFPRGEGRRVEGRHMMGFGVGVGGIEGCVGREGIYVVWVTKSLRGDMKEGVGRGRQTRR